MKKKILVLTSWYPNPSSAVSGIFVQDQALALSEKFDVAVLAPVLVDWKKYFLSLRFRRKHLVQKSNILVLTHEVTTLPGVRFFYSIWLQNYYEIVKHCFEELVTLWGKPDIIHAHIVLPSGWAASRIGQAYGIPVVLTEHTGPYSIHLRTSLSRKLARETLSSVNTVIAVSPALKEQMQDFQPDLKIDIVGNIVNDEFFDIDPTAQNPGEGRFRFLSVAILRREKGFEYLLEAAKLLSRNIREDFEIVIIGDGPHRAILEREVKRSGLSEHFRFVGFQIRSEIKQWINRSNVFVLPSLGETFGVVLVEAMACGKPVIATRCGGPEFIVTPESGILVEKANAYELARAMEDFIKGDIYFNPQFVRSSVVRRFGKSVFLQRMTALYDMGFVK